MGGSRSKNIGTAFEYHLVDVINKEGDPRGIYAKRVWYSGAGLKEPYDVRIRKGKPEDSPLILGVEAKRTMQQSLNIQRDWLTPIRRRVDMTPAHVVMFAVGKYPGRPVPVYVIRLPGEIEVQPKHVFKLKDKQQGCTINRKFVVTLGMGPYIIEMRAQDTSCVFVIEPFQTFWTNFMEAHR